MKKNQIRAFEIGLGVGSLVEAVVELIGVKRVIQHRSKELAQPVDGMLIGGDRVTLLVG